MVRPAFGLAPLDVALSVNIAALPADVRSIEWDPTGAGTFSVAVSPQSIAYRYDQPGVFTPRVVVTDTNGTRYVDTAVIAVVSASQLEAVLRRRWTEFKAALASQATQAASAFLHPGARDKYEPVLSALTSDLPGLSAKLGDMALVGYFGPVATLVTTLEDNGQTQLFFIDYSQDASGLWKLSAM